MGQSILFSYQKRWKIILTQEMMVESTMSQISYLTFSNNRQSSQIQEDSDCVMITNKSNTGIRDSKHLCDDKIFEPG